MTANNPETVMVALSVTEIDDVSGGAMQICYEPRPWWRVIFAPICY